MAVGSRSFFGAMAAIAILIAGPAASAAAQQDELSLQSQQSDQKPAPAAAPAATPTAGQDAQKTDEQKKAIMRSRMPRLLLRTGFFMPCRIF